MLENKSGNISETRKDRGKVTIYGLYEITNVLSNGTIPDPLRASFSPRLGVRNPHSNCNLKSRENECTEINSLYDRNIGFGGIDSMGIARDRPNFFASGYPLLTQEQVKLRISNLAGTFIGYIPTKVH